jgi:hypothetical protein
MKKRVMIKSLAGLVLLLSLAKTPNAQELRVYNGAIGNDEVGSSYMFNEYREDSSEGFDTNDEPRATSGSSKDQWLKIYSSPYEVELRRDCRPINSEAAFTNYLQAIDKLGAGINCTNQLKFTIEKDSNSNRDYTIKIINPKTQEQSIIDIRELIRTNEGYVTLGEINATNNEIYRRLEISGKFCQTNPIIIGIKSWPKGNSIEARVHGTATPEVLTNCHPQYWLSLTNLTKSFNKFETTTFSNLPQSFPHEGFYRIRQQTK